MEQLANVDETDIFKYRSIQAIIAFRWGASKQYVLRYQLWPYLFFFINYLTFVFYILNIDEDFE